MTPAADQKSTVAAEDYVKIIYAAQEWRPATVTTSSLAARLGVGAPSVSEMVRRLRDQGLVTHERYGPVSLTDEGRALALQTLRRHRIVETFLVAELGYTWDEVHDEAEQLEHVISDRLLERMSAALGHPTRDPHGDPIPGPDGTVEQPDAVPMADLDAGESGRVARISDADADLLRYLGSQGFVLDARVEVLRRQPYAASRTVAVGESGAISELDLTDVAARALWIVRTS
jgi:DtxR family transcriptional regulator, Mn-dependent transcriptional regulator